MVKLFNLIQQAQSQDKKPMVNHRLEKPMQPTRNVSGLKSEQKQGIKAKAKDRNDVVDGREGLLLFLSPTIQSMISDGHYWISSWT